MKEQELSKKHIEELRQMRIQDLAQAVVAAKAKGLLDGWRDYLHDQQIQAGISNDEMRQAIANMA